MSICRFLIIAIVLTMAAFMSVGCGGSDEITIEGGSLPKAQFVSRADAICKSARQRFETEYAAYVKKVTKESQQSPGSQIEAIVGEIFIPSYEQGIDEIVALGAPKGEEAQIAAFLNALQRRLDELHASPEELSKNATPFAKVAKLAKANGLDACAESLS